MRGNPSLKRQLQKKMLFAIRGFAKKKMLLTIGCRFRRRVEVGVQVWVSWVRILWRVRLSGRFGRVGPGCRLDGLDPKYPFRLVARGCG